MEQVTTFKASGYAIGDLQLFHDVDTSSVAELLADCPVVRVEAGELILEPHGKNTPLYLVLRGAIGARNADMQTGKTDNAIAKLLPGECVGELAVLDEAASTTTVCALEEAELLVISADRLWQLIDHSNGVARNLLRLLSFRIRAANALSLIHI